MNFFLFGIGGSEYQERVNRPDGYMWNQILFCAVGGGTLAYDGKEVRIRAGDYFFLPKDKPHTYYPDGALWDVRWIAFEGSICDEILARFGMTAPAVITPADETIMERIFDKMVISQENDILYCDYTCSGLLYDYLIGFHRLMDANTDSARSRQISMLLPVLRFMHDNFRSDISMTQLRMDEAKRLLTERDIPVSDAAEKSGFRDAGYFSTVFKKQEGMSPVEYKKKMKLKS
ncbi:MAG: AraC family transcriptional regulator [Lachnospiraceae bacterium]|nr:AraC family transcriptional regulator [Lachnospiraceae bacterium]